MRMAYCKTMHLKLIRAIIIVLHLTLSSEAFSYGGTSAIPHNFQSEHISVEGVTTQHRPNQCSRLTFTTLRASSVIDSDRNKKVGAGFQPFPPGKLQLFDPNVQGKLQGTNELQSRIEQGSQFTPKADTIKSQPTNIGDFSPSTSPSAPIATGTKVLDAQHWLENIGLPLNFAKPTSPLRATILGSTRIIGDEAPGDIKHVVMKLPPGMQYVEGQSISIIPPGVDPTTSRPNKPRLYSIASTRYGDLLDGTTVSLCVRRALYYDPVTGQGDPSRSGVCSNFLCDATPGTIVDVAGPVGKTMLLPDDRNTDIIMVATGTGIAPFRAFLHRLFMENTVARHLFGGTAWLVLGVPTTTGLLYDEEFRAMQAKAAPGALKIDYAISREMKNSRGGKLYVQDAIAERADEIFHRLDGGAHMYFCGLRGMMPPILDTLETVCSARGFDWSAKLKQLKDKNQWHVEVY